MIELDNQQQTETQSPSISPQGSAGKLTSANGLGVKIPPTSTSGSSSLSYSMLPSVPIDPVQSMQTTLNQFVSDLGKILPADSAVMKKLLAAQQVSASHGNPAALMLAFSASKDEIKSGLQNVVQQNGIQQDMSSSG